MNLTQWWVGRAPEAWAPAWPGIPWDPGEQILVGRGGPCWEGLCPRNTDLGRRLRPREGESCPVPWGSRHRGFSAGHLSPAVLHAHGDEHSEQEENDIFLRQTCYSSTAWHRGRYRPRQRVVTVCDMEAPWRELPARCGGSWTDLASPWSRRTRVPGTWLRQLGRVQPLHVLLRPSGRRSVSPADHGPLSFVLRWQLCALWG